MRNLSILLFLAILITACSQESNLEINLQQSEIFLDKNLLNSSVIEIEPGLQYIVLESSQSNSPNPDLSDTITADFHGTLIDGSVFWSSIEIGEPLTIQLSQLIPGCQKVISRMKEGDFWRVFIHPNLAYGEEGRSTIPPNSALTFDIELHLIEDKP
jgi:FKBP-type peptidyl-prolyl cis-trans isomerase